MNAAVCGKEKVKELLKDPHVLATINQGNRGGVTALLFSSYTGNLNITRMLTEAGADVDKGDKSGYTPLVHYCKNGRISIALHLLEAGADPMKADNYCFTCFHFAANHNNLDTMKMLLAPYPWPEGWFVAMLCMQRRANQYLEQPDAKPEGVAFLYGGGFLRKVGEYLRPKHLGITKKHWVTPEWLANAKTIPKPEDKEDYDGRWDKTALELAETEGNTEIASAIRAFLGDLAPPPISPQP